MKNSWFKAAVSKIRKDSVFSDEAGFARYVETQVLTKRDAEEAILGLQAGLKQVALHIESLNQAADAQELSIKKVAVEHLKSGQKTIQDPDVFAQYHAILGNTAFDLLDVNDRTHDKFMNILSQQNSTFNNRIAFLEKKFGLPPSRPAETNPQGALENNHS